MGKICENGQKVYAAYRVAKLLKIYEDCSPNGFYQRWKQKNTFMNEQAEAFGTGRTDSFMMKLSRLWISGVQRPNGRMKKHGKTEQWLSVRAI